MPILRVLIVEDMTAMRMLLAKTFEEMGFDVVESENGYEAWVKLNESPEDFTLICSDLTMPQWSGLDLLRAVRAEERTKHLPFIMLTADGDVKSVKEAIAAKVDDYIHKPFTTEKLRSRVLKHTANLKA